MTVQFTKQPDSLFVAAYPITVGMEELVLSNNKNISSTEGKDR
ncbi:hypothetical protein P7H19_25595 [Paenibacillus larvae]|nr:hypothetical protein [Paenibacillus larvae]MDT2238988.1 hypothetical protein [Paenibacillus larvae]